MLTQRGLNCQKIVAKNIVGANVMKLHFCIIFTLSVQIWHFLPSLIFAGKARSLTLGLCCSNVLHSGRLSPGLKIID
jgi:hypothetical protein